MTQKFVESQNRKRAAVRRALDRHKVFVSHKTFQNGTFTARVLFEGEYYDLSSQLFALVENGRTPKDLGLEPVHVEEE